MKHIRICTVLLALSILALLCMNVSAAQDVRFSDVADRDYFYEPVRWALGERITQGVSDTAFDPGAACTRGQIVTFLWRAFGTPDPAAQQDPFADVAANSYYSSAVLWAGSKKITLGTSADRFSPERPCTRAQIVTFLWRSVGEPKQAAPENPFADVRESDYYYQAVLWAVQSGITYGTTERTFGPDQSCTRGQTVTFLYRARDQIAAQTVQAAPTIPTAPTTPVIPDVPGSSTGNSNPILPAGPTHPASGTDPADSSGSTASPVPYNQPDPNAGTWIP